MTAANSSTDDGPTPIDLICVTADHIESGKRIPDGEGTLTVSGRRWAIAPPDGERTKDEETGGVLWSISNGTCQLPPAREERPLLSVVET